MDEIGRRQPGLVMRSDPKRTPILLGQTYEYEFTALDIPIIGEWVHQFMVGVQEAVLGAQATWVGVESYTHQSSKVFVQLRMPTEGELNARVSAMSLEEAGQYTVTESGLYVSKKAQRYVRPLIGLVALFLVAILAGFIISAVLALFGLLAPARVMAMFSMGGLVALITPGLWKVLAAAPLGWGLLELGGILSGIVAPPSWIANLSVTLPGLVRTRATIRNLSDEAVTLRVELIHTDKATGRTVDRTYDLFGNPKWQRMMVPGEFFLLEDSASKLEFSINEHMTTMRAVDADTGEIMEEKTIDPSFRI